MKDLMSYLTSAILDADRMKLTNPIKAAQLCRTVMSACYSDKSPSSYWDVACILHKNIVWKACGEKRSIISEEYQKLPLEVRVVPLPPARKRF